MENKEENTREYLLESKKNINELIRNKELKLFSNYGVVLIKFGHAINENINIQYLGTHIDIREFNSLSNNMRISFKKYFIKKIFDENNEEDNEDNNNENNIGNDNY